jgi:peroxiredoxin
MRLHRLFCRFLIALVLFLMLPAGLYALPQSGQAAPEFKVVTTSGQTVTLDNFKNNVLLLDFFASWCIPCRTSVPHLVELNSKYGKQGLQILGISADDNLRGLRSFADLHRISYPIAMNGETIQKSYGIRSLPVMFLIDKKGKIDATYIGYSNEIARAVETRIKQLLKTQ